MITTNDKSTTQKFQNQAISMPWRWWQENIKSWPRRHTKLRISQHVDKSRKKPIVQFSNKTTINAFTKQKFQDLQNQQNVFPGSSWSMPTLNIKNRSYLVYMWSVIHCTKFFISKNWQETVQLHLFTHSVARCSFWTLPNSLPPYSHHLSKIFIFEYFPGP